MPHAQADPFLHQNEPSRESIICGKAGDWWRKRALFVLKLLLKRRHFFCLASVRLSKLVGIVYLGFLGLLDVLGILGFLGFLDVLGVLVLLVLLVSLAKLNMLFISRRKHFFTFSLFHPFTFNPSLPTPHFYNNPSAQKSFFTIYIR